MRYTYIAYKEVRKNPRKISSPFGRANQPKQQDIAPKFSSCQKRLSGTRWCSAMHKMFHSFRSVAIQKGEPIFCKPMLSHSLCTFE